MDAQSHSDFPVNLEFDLCNRLRDHVCRFIKLVLCRGSILLLYIYYTMKIGLKIGLFQRKQRARIPTTVCVAAAPFQNFY